MQEPLKNSSLTPFRAAERSKRIMICDSNPVLADGIRMILQGESHLNNFLISAGTNTDLNAFAPLAPLILIVDPWQCKDPGASVADTFAHLSSITSLIGYCPDISPAEARLLSLVGFRGIMPKTVQSEELVRIVMAVIFGGVYLHESYSEHYTPQYPTDPDPSDETTGLTEREAEVLRHVALGSSMKEIANLLRISTKTVDTYKTRANQKLNLRSRSDIVRYAIRSGWMN